MCTYLHTRHLHIYCTDRAIGINREESGRSIQIIQIDAQYFEAANCSSSVPVIPQI